MKKIVLFAIAIITIVVTITGVYLLNRPTTETSDQPPRSWTLYGDCQTGNWEATDHGTGKPENVSIKINREALESGSCLFAFNIEPAIENGCGTSNWLPCVDMQGNAFTDIVQIKDRETGQEFPVIVVPNGQGGANFTIDWKHPKNKK